MHLGKGSGKMLCDTLVLVYREWGLELDSPMDEEAVQGEKHVIHSCQLSYIEAFCGDSIFVQCGEVP